MAGLFPERSGVSWSANKFFLPPSSHHPALGRSLALEKEGLAEREERVEELSGDSPPTIPLLISSLLFLRRLLIAPVTLGEPLLSCLAATRAEEHAEPDEPDEPGEPDEPADRPGLQDIGLGPGSGDERAIPATSPISPISPPGCGAVLLLLLPLLLPHLLLLPPPRPRTRGRLPRGPRGLPRGPWGRPPPRGGTREPPPCPILGPPQLVPKDDGPPGAPPWGPVEVRGGTREP